MQTNRISSKKRSVTRRALSPLRSLPQVYWISGAMAWDITSPRGGPGGVCSEVVSGKLSEGSPKLSRCMFWNRYINESFFRDPAVF
jgi:hypothetical protein